MSGYEPKPDPRIEAVARGTGKVVLVVSGTGALAFLLFGALLYVTPPPAEPLVIFATWFIGFAVVVPAVRDWISCKA
jgi:hypothetical protein